MSTLAESGSDSEMSEVELVAELSNRWDATHSAMLTFLDDLDATEDAQTITITVVPREVESRQQFTDWLNPRVRGDGKWAKLVGSFQSSGEHTGFALPVANWRVEDAFIFPFLQIHPLLTAWWLTNAWRTRQLARAALALARSDERVAAAACARPLIETAAAFWVDGGRLVTAWDQIKRAGKPLSPAEAIGRTVKITELLYEITMGGKFDHRIPGLEELGQRYKRSNVLGQIDKLAKALGSNNLQADYQWLCNTVHPSVGNTYSFSASPAMHKSGTHFLTSFAGRPREIEIRGNMEWEQTVLRATARGATSALMVLHTCFEATLRTVDDVALTTGAPRIARHPYWRNLRVPGRNHLCPCRSGMKVKRCKHDWGDPAPVFPSTFA